VRLIAPDPRGLGRSGDAPGPLTSHRLARDLVGILDHLGIQRTAVLGSSMGAWVARRLAALHPDRVEALILCTPGGGDSPYARRVRALLRALLDAGGPDDLMDHIFTLVLSPRFLNENEPLVRELARMSRPDARARRTMAGQLEMMAREAGDPPDPVPSPVLILAGAQDRLVPLGELEALRSSIPGSRLVILEGAAHHPFLEAPKEAVDHLVSFMEDPSGRLGNLP
jgi:pimeloyl-ACP methyl ester carboxylesterase